MYWVINNSIIISVLPSFNCCMCLCVTIVTVDIYVQVWAVGLRQSQVSGSCRLVVYNTTVIKCESFTLFFTNHIRGLDAIVLTGWQTEGQVVVSQLCCTESNSCSGQTVAASLGVLVHWMTKVPKFKSQRFPNAEGICECGSNYGWSSESCG